MRRLLIIAGGVAILLLGGFIGVVWYVGNAIGGCSYTPLTRVASPDGLFVAHLARGECGATVGYFTAVSVTRHGASPDFDRRRTLTVMADAVEPMWQGDTLVIRYRGDEPPTIGKSPVAIRLEHLP